MHYHLKESGRDLHALQEARDEAGVICVGQVSGEEARMSGIVGVVCLSDEVHEICTSVYIEFVHDLVLELAGGEGWALDGGSRLGLTQPGLIGPPL